MNGKSERKGELSLESGESHYQVVARRYRPQTFEELVGQEHVAQALKNAVQTGRVGHAYLFAGARGVGKTSAARILAKALNCERGPTPEPCNKCSFCMEIAQGGAIDVLEIDGASNRGIEEVRALRQNATLRPSRARFKIYIIDEVHMLTREAFNALLKTLEEPPPHVKFIFCTTEPTKIPPTILSRCQRFDFAGISAASICRRLGQIVEAEGIPAEEAALEIIARRAGGSMRDAQSLLEQVLAFGGGAVTKSVVRDLLGLGPEEIVGNLAELIAEGEVAKVLQAFAKALDQGIDLAVLMEQLACYYRDMLVVAAGCGPELLLFSSPEEIPRLKKLADRYGIDTVLAAFQILDHTLARMKYSFHPRLVAEAGLARLARLNSLLELGSLLARLEAEKQIAPIATPARVNSGSAQLGRPQDVGARLAGASQPATELPSREDPQAVATQLKQMLALAADKGANAQAQTSAPSAAKPVRTKAGESKPASTEPPVSAARSSVSAGDVPSASEGQRGGSLSQSASSPTYKKEGRSARLPGASAVWLQLVEQLGGYTAELIRDVEDVKWQSPNCLAVTFPTGRQIAKSACQAKLKELENGLSVMLGRPARIEITVAGGAAEEGTTSETQRPEAIPRPGNTSNSRNWRTHPLVRKAAEIFDAVPSNPENVGE
ncbi:MAG: DNA polymerase III subunit gamma/tau [Thermoguttaceae bacterium]|nr:DNA polymerase III subunit gamma/tau [Thermoguttaceae bacterium]